MSWTDRRPRGSVDLDDWTGRYRVPRGHWASRLAPYAPPWLAVVVLHPVAAVMHHAWAGPALPWATAALTLLGAVLTGVSWVAASGRAPVTRIHAVITAAATTGYLTAATVIGVTTRPLLDVSLTAGAALAASWNIRKVLRNSREDGEGDGGLFERVKLAGTKVRAIETKPNRVTAALQLPAGELTTDDVSAQRARIASALDLPATAVRVGRNPESEARPDLVIVPEDVLRRPTVWPGPSSIGGSVAEPLVLGVYEDGEPVQLWLPGDPGVPRNTTHLLVMGMNGSGKSHGARLALTELLTRDDVVVWAADPVKGLQTLGPVVPGLDWCALTPAAAKTMIGCLPAVITARANELGRRGHDQWVPGCGLPFLVVWVEEASTLVRDSTEFIDIAQQARSAGVSLVLSLQRPSFRNITTDVRQQMGAVWCHGVKSLDDAAFALSDELLDAGANPAAWGNRRPGYAYLEAPGVDEQRMPTPSRSYGLDSADQLTAAITAYDGRVELDPVTTAAAGDAYARRRTNPQQEGAVVSITTARSHRSADPFDEPLSDTADATHEPIPASPEPDLAGDPDADLPTDVPEIRFPTVRPTPAQARELLGRELDRLRAEGREEIGPRDVDTATVGRSRPWVSAALANLALRGDLQETDREGVYRLPGHAA